MFATWGPRILAPLFLVGCAIAVLSVVNANDSGAPAERGGQAAQQGGGQNGGGQGGEDSGNEGDEGSGEETYTVESGDAFSTIAEEAGISTQRLERLNPDADPTALQPGQVLQLR
ncbi:LysM peptidoglycan-binding domain-containing protein [Thermoleophilia bacterium SCSIO 60948]|nr:LysM peptidoglycan-binding domain-containing protein [Thermoleophilia bacterium SCSIO 60948]